MSANILKLVFMVSSVSGCVATDHAPLYFGQATTLGVGVAGGTTGAPTDFTVGYRNANMAVVPTLTEEATGERPIQAVLQGAGGEGGTDALSTFGSFDARTEGQTVSIGQFFATGLPGQHIAQGLACAAAAAKGAANSAICGSQ